MRAFWKILRAAALGLGLMCSSAQAEMSGIIPGGGFFATATIGTTIVFQAQTDNISASTTYTFTSAAIGTASANRDVIVGIVCAGGGATETYSGLTIGGTSAAQVVTSTMAGAGQPLAAIYILAVASGTTATIVATLSSNKTTNCTIDVWAAYGLASTTADNTASANNTGAVSTSVTTVNGGVAVGILGVASASTGTWGGTLSNNANAVVNSVTAVAGGSQTTSGAASTMTYSLTTAKGAAAASFH